MSRKPISAICVAALAALLTACGTSQSQQTVTARQAALAKGGPGQIIFSSPVLASDKTIPARYKCAQKIWLPLQWGSLPAGTSELVLLFGAYDTRTRVAKGKSSRPIVASALVMGLKPTIHRLGVGEIPRGAQGWLQAGVPACPPQQTPGRKFVFALFALSRAKSFKRHPPVASTPTGALVDRLNRTALAIGGFTATYPRS